VLAELDQPLADGVRVALQRLRRIRDWLLVAAAISILLIRLSLVGLTYLASG